MVSQYHLRKGHLAPVIMETARAGCSPPLSVGESDWLTAALVSTGSKTHGIIIIGQQCGGNGMTIQEISAERIREMFGSIGQLFCIFSTASEDW